MSEPAMSDPLVQKSVRHLLRAEKKRARAHAHLRQTLGRIERRMSPEGLADDAGRAIHAKLAQLGRRSVAAARERPVALAAGAGAVMAMLAGRPLWQGARHLLARRHPAAH